MGLIVVCVKLKIKINLRFQVISILLAHAKQRGFVYLYMNISWQQNCRRRCRS